MSVVEVGARPARATPVGVGCRAIVAGRTMTISPDLVCMRLGNTERHQGRSNAVTRIQRVPCLLCPVCLCYQAQCVASGAAVAPATPATTLGTHAPVPLHLLEHSAGCVSQSLLHLRAFR